MGDSTGVSIRAITEDEARHIDTCGWVFLPSLLDAKLAEELLERGKALIGANFAGRTKSDLSSGFSQKDNTFFANYYRAAYVDRLCASVAFSPQMGRNAALLLGRDMAIRSHTDLMAVKLPKRMQTKVAGKEETTWHQDTTLVQSLSISFWIALTAISPEMGTMQFRNGSHHLGPLYPPLDEWPRLQELPVSEPLSYKPGDATAHVSWTAHCAAANDSDSLRWAYICSYLPSDAPFLGIPSQFTDQLAAAKEIAPGKPLAHSSFPLVYGGRGEQV
jgi:hypothetical protein